MASQGTSNRMQQMQSSSSQQQGGQMAQISNDLLNYFTEYARQNPGYAALWCIGVGFVLGWKLKPW